MDDDSRARNGPDGAKLPAIWRAIRDRNFTGRLGHSSQVLPDVQSTGAAM